MFVMLLDVKQTHDNNPECPMRLVQHPNGNWMCSDCGLEILWKKIEVRPVADELKGLNYQVTREQAPTFTISEAQPLAMGNTKTIAEIVQMVKAIAPAPEFKDFFERHEHGYNMDAPVEGFDRNMVMCCNVMSDESTGNSSYAGHPLPRPGVLCGQVFTGGTSSLPPLAIQMSRNQDFVKQTEAGWKAIEQGHYHTLSFQQLRQLCGLE